MTVVPAGASPGGAGGAGPLRCPPVLGPGRQSLAGQLQVEQLLLEGAARRQPGPALGDGVDGNCELRVLRHEHPVERAVRGGEGAAGRGEVVDRRAPIGTGPPGERVGRLVGVEPGEEPPGAAGERAKGDDGVGRRTR